MLNFKREYHSTTQLYNNTQKLRIFLSQIKTFIVTSYYAEGTAPLSFLTNLEYLDLGNYDGYIEIDSLNPLLDLKNLKGLSVWTLNNQHIEELSKIKWLKRLNIGDWEYGSCIKNLDFLYNLPNINDFNLYGNDAVDISGLLHLKKLNALGLSDIKLTTKNIDIIFSNKNLCSLYLGRCVNNLNVLPLDKIPKLTSLILYDNFITNIDKLEKLTNLNELILGYNEIQDITPLKNLINLNKLDLGYNQIQDITPLQGLKELKMLDLSNNPISKSQVDWLKKQLPDCAINHSGCIPANDNSDDDTIPF